MTSVMDASVVALWHSTRLGFDWDLPVLEPRTVLLEIRLLIFHGTADQVVPHRATGIGPKLRPNSISRPAVVRTSVHDALPRRVFNPPEAFRAGIDQGIKQFLQ
jgi:hypothetical protein